MNVAIRPYEPGDAVAFHEAARESWREVEPWMLWAHENYSLAEAEAWVAQQTNAFAAREMFEFVIADDDTGRFLGGIGINQIDDANRRANVGYWVRASAARQGVATAAVRQVIAWARANTKLERLEILVAADNAASLRVAERVAVREGVLRNRLLLHGVFHDAVLFAVIV
jgi:RimJ/RimL family protein N-acetyltransferase